MIEINRDPTERDLRIFSVLQLVFFAIIAASLYRRFDLQTTALAIVVVSSILCIVGTCVPRYVKPVFVGWLYAVFPIGWTVSMILMLTTFYGLITPLGLLARLVGHDPLSLRWKRQTKSYWIERDKQRPTTDYFRQF